MAALLFRFMIAVTTSVLGSAIAVVGAMSLFYHVGQVGHNLRVQVETAPYMLPLIVAAPALVGIVYQLHQTEGRAEKEDRQKPGKE